MMLLSCPFSTNHFSTLAGHSGCTSLYPAATTATPLQGAPTLEIRDASDPLHIRYVADVRLYGLRPVHARRYEPWRLEDHRTLLRAFLRQLYMAVLVSLIRRRASFNFVSLRMKMSGMLKKVKLRGIEKVGWLFTFTGAAYNLCRLRNLMART